MVRFVIYQDRAGNYRWRLIAGNGEKVAASEGYTLKQSAIRSAYHVKELAAIASVTEE